jgi:putative CocE/NonD family hydrolase
LKAIFPVVPGNDLYKDTATMGGLIDMEFDAFYLALTGGLNTLGPIAEGLQNPAILLSLLPAEIAHLEDLGTFDATFAAQTLLGKASAYDGAYWQHRNPATILQKVVDNHIPAYLVGGEYDLFQRGEPLDFSGLQNAWAGRPVSAPMTATQPVTGRYQLIDGPFTHLSGASAQLDPLMLEWFDTWLKGVDTGMARTPTPLHYYDLGTQKWTEHARYPFEGTVATRYWFSPEKSGTAPLSVNDHSLSPTKPTTTSSDKLLWSPVGNPCGRPTDQWAAGIPSLIVDYVQPGTPCVDGDDTLGQLGVDRATYTTTPLPSAQTIAGPIDVTVYATANRPDTQWVAEVEDVAPDGTSIPLTEGALLGSLRAVSSDGTWRGADGQILLPNHPFTRSSQQPVRKGVLTRYDIEVFPTYATIAAGHRIRVSLSTADTPHLAPTLPALADLTGGIYHVRLSPSRGSAVELPLVLAS